MSRIVAVAAAVTLVTVLALPSKAQSQAQAYPNRQVRIVGGLAAGGPADLASRIVAQALQEKLGQTFIVENRLGGGGVVAVQEVARAPKDGYTLGAPTTGPLTILPNLLKAAPYQTFDAVTPIALIASYPYVLSVRKDLPVNSVAELLDYARKNPGKLSYGSGGQGTSNHLGMEWFKEITKTDIVHVPYKGDNDIIADLVGGRIDLAMNTPAVIRGQIQTGNVKALAVASERRLPIFEQLPTMKESGVQDFVVEAYTVIVGPAGLPADITEKLNVEINTILKKQEVIDKFAVSTMYPGHYNVEELRKFIGNELQLWKRIIQTANVPLQ